MLPKREIHMIFLHEFKLGRTATGATRNVIQALGRQILLKETLKDEGYIHMNVQKHQSCQVCGDTSAAFYCGANVCEACKKFFIRSWKQSSENNYVCVQERNCIITKETRKRCARCRYDRCLELKMYLPGGPSLLGEISRIPCRVCNSPSTGFHFGTLTCEGCKGFFRRCCQDKKSEKLKCTENGSCEISFNVRGMCKSCRLKKCFSVGMRAEKCKIGRRPNIIKHTTKLELQKMINLLDDKNCEKTDSKHSNRDDDDLDDDKANGNSSWKRRLEVDDDVNSLNIESIPEISDSCSKSRISSENLPGYVALNELHQTDEIVSRSPFESRENSNLHGNANIVRETVFTEPLILSDRMPKASSAMIENGGFSRDFVYPVVLARTTQPEETRFTSVTCDFMGGHEMGSFNEWGDETMAQELLVKYSGPNVLDKPTLEEMVCIMRHSFSYLTPILSRQLNATLITENSSIDEMWKAQMQQFERSALAILAFSRRIPGFKKLPLSAQIELIQKSLYPVAVCVLSTLYSLKDNSFSYFSFSHSEMKAIFMMFPMCCPLTRTFISMGQKVRSINMDSIEVAFLCAVFLLDTGGRYEYKELLIDSLEFYVKGRYGEQTDRHHHILMALRTMSDINQIHKQMILNLLKDPKFSSLSIPQLFEEAFINSEYTDT